jgi:hypothetical protein
MNPRNWLLLLLSLLVIQACGQSSAYLLGPIWHQDVEVLVEVRPGKPKVGMNELIVIATRKNRVPAYEFVISIKRQGDSEWRQSIQDGHSGVYRRALNIVDPINDVLIVQMENGDDKVELAFPLTKK